MKKIIAFTALIAIVFSSCNGKYTIAKRKYTKGFYVSKSSNHNTKPAALENAVTKNEKKSEKIETLVVAKTPAQTKAEPVEIAAIRTIAQPEMMTKVSKTGSVKNEPIASTSKNNYTPAAEIKPVKINNATLNAAKGKGDGNLVLMIILCFLWFFNLIAVYMHDGGITTNFWITLLLDFTLIGGVIFSLLVVLDIVDLS